MTDKISQQPTANSYSYNSIPKPRYEITSIDINGQILEYEARIFELDTLGAIDEASARVLFLKTKELFDKAGLKFSLVFGTLLGAVREGSLIHGDQDMDICVWDEGKLRDNLLSFQSEGLKVCRILPGFLYSFRMDDSSYIDVYILRELKGLKYLPWRRYCVSLCGYETPRKFFKKWSETEFMGEKVTCPENPERLLEFWYGSDWRVPQNKKGNYRVKSAYYCHMLFSLPYRLKAMCTKVYKFLTDKEYRQRILQRKRETGSHFFKH